MSIRGSPATNPLDRIICDTINVDYVIMITTKITKIFAVVMRAENTIVFEYLIDF